MNLNKNVFMKNWLNWILYISSIIFFILGLSYPIMGSKLFLRIEQDDIYLFSSATEFLKDGEIFLGSIILIFTIIFPILKYLFLGTRLLSIPLPNQKAMGFFLELVNKWAMLDVFIVALIILNMKFDSLILATNVKIGTSFFALSILLMMICSFTLKNQSSETDKMSQYLKIK